MRRYFIDTNVIVYANDCAAGEKQDRAIEVIRQLMLSQCGVISTQVLQEYANVALNKLNQDSSVVLRQMRLLEGFVQPPLTGKTARRAVEITVTYQVSFWDANIVAAAEAVDCDVILTEDLNPGQLYAGIEVVDPFASGFQLSEI